MQHIQDSRLVTPNQNEKFGTQNIKCAAWSPAARMKRNQVQLELYNYKWHNIAAEI